MANIIKSPFKAPNLPQSSIFEFLWPSDDSDTRAYPAVDPNGPAFIDGLNGRTISRGDLGLQARKLASGLRSKGLRKGDVVMIFGTNSLEWVNALFGSQAAGLIVSPASYGYGSDELLHQIRDSTTSFIFVAPDLLPTVRKTLKLPNAPKIPDSHIVLLCSGNAKSSDSKLQCIEELWGEPITVERFKKGEEQRTAYLCYSSGTTGRAKGVETTHHNITSQVQALDSVYEDLKPGIDTKLGVLPFSHIYGLTVTLHQPLVRGIPVVVIPRFEAQSVLAAIKKYNITFLNLVPPVLIGFLHAPGIDQFLKPVRTIMSGAAPLGPELVAAFEKKYPWITVTQGYGMTETSPVTHMMTTEESRGHAGQIGKLMPTYTARLVEPETGKDAAPGGRGELWLKGPSVMKGYWRNQEATNNTFSDGWLKTGDVAMIAEDGYFSIVDRVKELIKYKGFQGKSAAYEKAENPVPPAELEALLLSHPKIADAAVIGIYSKDQATELPRAYITPTGGIKAFKTEEDKAAFSKEITKWVEGKVAQYKRLRGGVLLMETIPKSPSGKILRKDLRALAKKEEEDNVKATRQAKL